MGSSEDDDTADMLRVKPEDSMNTPKRPFDNFELAATEINECLKAFDKENAILLVTRFAITVAQRRLGQAKNDKCVTIDDKLEVQGDFTTIMKIDGFKKALLSYLALTKKINSMVLTPNERLVFHDWIFQVMTVHNEIADLFNEKNIRPHVWWFQKAHEANFWKGCFDGTYRDVSQETSSKRVIEGRVFRPFALGGDNGFLKKMELYRNTVSPMSNEALEDVLLYMIKKIPDLMEHKLVKKKFKKLYPAGRTFQQEMAQTLELLDNLNKVRKDGGVSPEMQKAFRNAWARYQEEQSRRRLIQRLCGM